MPLNDGSLGKMLEHQRATNTQNLNTAMNDTVISFVIRLINSKAGGLVQAAVGAAIGWLVATLAAKGFHVPPDLVADLTKWLVVAGMAAVGAVVQYLQTKQVHKVQAALGVETDGHIGPVTIRRAEAVGEA